jgi:4-amino-4-deoxy-L-arabinose transferase-like glycosyltransferase
VGFPHLFEPQENQSPDEIDHVTTLLTLMLGAVELVTLGQGAAGSSSSQPLLVIGIGLFVLAFVSQRRRALPAWLKRTSEYLQMRPAQLVLWVMALGLAWAAHLYAGNLWKMALPLAAVTAWLLALLLTAVSSRRAGATPAAANDLPWSRAEQLAVVALFVIAFLLRAVGNGEIPHALTGDEGSAGLAAVDVLRGRLDNPFIVAWFSFPSMYFMVPAMFIAVLGQTFEALRMPSALAGALSVVGLYWLARPFLGRTVAGLSAIMLAALNLHIHFSRIGLNNVWDGLFFVYTLGFFWRGWRTGRRGFFWAAGLLLGLSQYFYTSARLLPAVIVAWLALTAVFEWKLFRQRIPDLLVMLLVTATTFLPLGLFFIEHPNEFMAPMNRVSVLAGDWLAYTSRTLNKPAWQVLADNFEAAALAFTTVPTRAWYGSGRPVLLQLPSALFILGLALGIMNVRDGRYRLMWLWLIGVIGVGALTESTPAGQRYVVGTPIAALFIGAALGSMANWLRDLRPQARSLVWGIALAIILIAAGLDLRFYFVDYARGPGQGDVNTQVATSLGRYLTGYPAGGRVFFFGPPRMGYRGFSTLPYLAPQVQGQDVIQALNAPVDFAIGSITAFVFLPERSNELQWVELRYPQGNTRWFRAADGAPLFLLYEVRQP